MSAYDFVQHGQELVEGQQYQEAVKICRLGLLAHPTAIAGRLVLGAALMFLRRYDEVLAEMRVALEIDGSNPRALALKGEALMYKGDPMQAAEVIEHALVYAPDDHKLRKLMQHVEILLATTDPSEYARLDHGTMTKNYPVHRGYDDDDDDDDYELTNEGNSITRPRDPHDAYRAYSSSGPKSSTMDIDPYLDGHEVSDSDYPRFDEVPPGSDDSMEMTRALDTHAMGGRARVDALDDLDDDLGPLAPPPIRGGGRMPPMPSNAPGIGEETAHYRKLPDDYRPGGPPGRSDRRGPSPRELPLPPAAPPKYSPPRGPSHNPAGVRSPITPSDLASRHDQQVALRRTQPGRRQNAPGRPPALPGPELEHLFPEEDGGVSRMLLTPEHPDAAPRGVAQAVKQIRQPHQPTLAISAADRAAAEVGPGMAPPARPPAMNPGSNLPLPPGAMPALGQDMQRLRDGQPAGTNGQADEHGLLESIVELDPENSPYRAAMPKPQASAPANQPVAAGKAVPAANAQATAAPSNMTASMPKKRSPLVYALYAVIALAVVAGGVFAGFKIREVRLDRQIRNTERDAATFAREDTYDGYSRARAAYARIVSVRSTPRTRSALARMDAALAAEYGEEYERASDLVGQLSTVENPDIRIARTYLALARGDGDAAKKLAKKLTEDYPDEAMGWYLTGRAALVASDLTGAMDGFDKASDLDKRPISQLGRGRTFRAQGEYDRARRAFDSVLDITDGHPAALIERGLIVVASAQVTEDVEDTIGKLQRIADGNPQDGPAKPARRQQARAALTLASIELLRGKNEEAKKALAQVSELMPKEDVQFSIDLTTALMDAGDLKDAAEEARRALDAWPKDVQVKIIAAEVAIRQQQPEKAVELLSIDIADNVQALTVRGRAYVRIGLLEKATSDLDKALALSPKRAETLLARARADLGVGDAEMAAKRLEPLYSDEAPPQIAVVYAAALRDNGKFKKAKTILERLIKLPRSGQAQLELARLERQKKRYKAAKAAYKAALEQLAGSVEVKLEAALMSFDIGEIKDAYERLQDLLKEAPQNPQVLLEAARVATLTSDFDNAELWLKAADKLPAAPRWQVAREQIRLAYRRKQFSTALARTLTVRDELKNEDEEVWFLTLEVQLHEDAEKEARITLEAILKRFARNAPIRSIARAQLAAYAGRYKGALEGYNKAKKTLKKLRANPHRIAQIDFLIGRVYFESGRLPEASRAFKRAVGGAPGNADAFGYLGQVELDRKLWKSAEKAFARVLELDPTSQPNARYFLGVALYGQKRWGPAKREFNKYKSNRPRGDYSLQTKQYLRKLR